jgi:imidazolonepropionase-like amidohydrolase
VAPRGVLEAVAAGASLAPTVVAKAEMVLEAHTESVRRAIAAGVKVAMGTDSGVAPHGRNLRELALMVECGMTPEQAIVATTRSAAELMAIDGEFGTVQPGKRADLVLASDDPAQPVSVDDLNDRIERVWMDGVEVTRRQEER